MMVECVGLPGVGKTTMLHAQSEALNKTFKIVDSRISYLWNSILTVVAYHMWLRWMIEDRVLTRKLAYRLSFRLIHLFSRRPVFLFDAGLVQVVLENLIETDFKDSHRKIKLLMRLRPRIDVLIYIYDDLDGILERELNRPSPRFQMGGGVLRTRYRQSLDILENRLLPCAGRVYKIKVGTPIDGQDIISG